jgi:hypothetical protein
MYNDSRQNAAEMLGKSVTIARKVTGLLPLSATVHRNMSQQKIRAKQLLPAS